MQKLIAVFLFVPLLVLAQSRQYNHTITQRSDTVISKEANYREKIETDKKGQRTCVVDLDIEIEGRWHKAHGSYIWDGGMLDGRACDIAAMRARNHLTTEIKPYTISSKAEIRYEENSNTKNIYGYKQGEMVDVSGLKQHPNYPKSFAHQGAECRWFYDIRKEEKGIKQYNLIACKLSAGWIVEDIFN